MFFMTHVTYPPGSSTKAASTFVTATATPLPSFMKRLHVLTTAKGEVGIDTFGIYEVDDNRVKEAMIEFTKYFVNFYGIEGFKYEIEPMLTVQEAIPLVLNR
jgi:hypothetical protein